MLTTSSYYYDGNILNDPRKLFDFDTDITKTRLFKYTENFTSKNWNFSDKKNSDIFHMFAQNIDYGYSLELHVFERNKKNNIYLCKPKFCHIKMGFKGVNII